MNIRNAVTADYKAIAEICRNDLGYECEDDLVRAKLSSLDSSREAVFATEYNKEVIGFVHIEKYDLLYCETFANVLGLAVKSDYRRLSAGKALMNEAEKWAKTNGASTVRLNSGFTRTDAHGFYRAIGYDNEKNQIRFMKKI